MDKKYNETMVISNGKLVYAVSMKDKTESSSNGTYIYIYNGQVYFSDSFFRQSTFDMNNENHQIAKEIFITQLQADIKHRILELKQLQAIFSELNLSECFGTVLEDNTKLLLEVKNQVEKVGKSVKSDVSEAIKENVKPIALKKQNNTSKEVSDNG